jgi:centromere protein J
LIINYSNAARREVIKEQRNKSKDITVSRAPPKQTQKGNNIWGNNNDDSDNDDGFFNAPKTVSKKASDKSKSYISNFDDTRNDDTPQIKLNKAPVTKTQVKQNIFTENIITKKDISVTNSRFENDSSHSYKPNNYIDEQEEELEEDAIACDNNPDEEDNDDDDDNRDIMSMYQKKSNNQFTSNTSYLNQSEHNSKGQNKIINKYFKPVGGNNSKKTEIEQHEPQIAEESFPDIMNNKLAELQAQVDKLKKENEKTEKLKKEYNGLLKSLQRQVEDFQEKKAKEVQEFEFYKENELKKIEKERRTYVNNTKLLQNMPNRKEREEIEKLNQQVVELQEEMKKRDKRNKLALERTNKLLEESKTRNDDLQKELRVMEELRIKNLPTAGSNSSKSKPRVNTTSNNVNMNTLANTNASINQTMNSNKSTKNLPLQKNMDMPLIIKDSNKSPIGGSRRAMKDIEPSDEESDNMSDYEKDTRVVNKREIVPNNHNRGGDYDAGETIQMNKNRVNVNKTPIISSNNRSDKFASNNISIMPNLKENSGLPKISKPVEAQKEIKSKQTIKYDDDEEVYELILPDQYHGRAVQKSKLVSHDILEDGKKVKIFENGKREIIFPSGVKKEIFDDGYSITYFTNKDIKQVFPDCKEVYLFSDSNTLQFKFTDGLQVFKFDNNQLEKHFPDGTKQVVYADGTIRYILADGYEETFYQDGSLQKVFKNGVMTIDYEDGIKVISCDLIF